MNKAVLLVEMPERCVDCELCEIIPSCDISDTAEYFCNVKYDGEQVKDEIAEKKRASWCPLRPLPEKYNSSYNTDYGVGYIRGWNSCIEAIEGSGEDVDKERTD